MRAVSEVVGRPLPYESLSEVRARMTEVAPTTTKYDIVEKANFASAALALAKADKGKVSANPLTVAQTALKQYYMTDSITRASSTMAKCVKAAAKPISDKA